MSSFYIEGVFAAVPAVAAGVAVAKLDCPQYSGNRRHEPEIARGGIGLCSNVSVYLRQGSCFKIRLFQPS